MLHKIIASYNIVEISKIAHAYHFNTFTSLSLRVALSKSAKLHMLRIKFHPHKFYKLTKSYRIFCVQSTLNSIHLGMTELFNALKLKILRNTYLDNYVNMKWNMFFSLLRNKYLSVKSRLSIDCFYALSFSVNRTFHNSTKSTKLVETRVAIHPRNLRTIKWVEL